jgi:hypothetical protein
MRLSHLLIIMVVAVAGTSASAQIAPELIDLRQRLVENTGAEYAAARDEVLVLPHDTFADLLFLLRLSPEYSLEHILSLILEARANHPEVATHFDGNLQHTLANPDMRGRHGRPIYRLWSSREPKEVHPLIYEALIKLDLPYQVRRDIRMRTSLPNPDNIPFILHFATEYSPGVLYDLVAVTEGYPEERERLRPLALQMYKEHRQQGNVGVRGVIGMFRSFGTPEDLEILRELREYERELMPAQGIVIGNWDEVGSTMYNARREYEQRKTDLANAER